MSSFAQEIGECRSLLAQPASEEVFEALCDVVGLTERDEDDPLLMYLEEQLKRWPQTIRRPTPERWLDFEAYSIYPIEAIRLCDTIVLDAEGSSFDEGELARVFKAAARAQVSALELIAHEDVDIGLDELYLESLAAVTEPWALRRLEVRYGNLYDSVKWLGAASCLSSLERLDLRYNQLGDDELLSLMSAPFIGSLQALYLQGNRISARGAVALAETAELSSLRRLDLRDNAIGARGAKALAKAQQLASLEWLALYRADVEPEGVRALAESRHLAPEICRYWRGMLG